jgi:serine/threonine protein kinase
MVDNVPDEIISVGRVPRTSGNSLSSRKPDPLIGTVFAERYTILEVLGRGGMGVVYKARHDLMDRVVAIKMILPHLVSDDVSLARFQREARAASKISHPNIIAIHDFGMTADTDVAYLVMDFIDGEDLSDVIKKDGQIGVQRSVRIFLQACDALQHAHKLGVIHRDLKPSNIMLINKSDKVDFVKILDFGVAKIATNEDEADQQRLTTTGEIFGSPVYMSPEQCNGAKLDARSDVYAFGCVMYETLTGKPPCMGKTPIETIAKHVTAMPPRFNEARSDLYIPEWIENIVFKSLQKDPAKRHQSMQELFDELYAGLTSNSTSQQMNALPSTLKMRAATLNKPVNVLPAPKPPSKAPVFIGIACGIAIAILAAGAYAFFANKPTQPNNRTERHSPVTTRHHNTASHPDTTPVTTTVHDPVVQSAPKTPVEHQVVSRQAHPVLSKIRKRVRDVIDERFKADDSEPPVSPRKRSGHDYYDYSIKHEGAGNPVDFPGR